MPNGEFKGGDLVNRALLATVRDLTIAQGDKMQSDPSKSYPGHFYMHAYIGDKSEPDTILLIEYYDARHQDYPFGNELGLVATVGVYSDYNDAGDSYYNFLSTQYRIYDKGEGVFVRKSADVSLAEERKVFDVLLKMYFDPQSISGEEKERLMEHEASEPPVELTKEDKEELTFDTGVDIVDEAEAKALRRLILSAVPDMSA